MRFEWDERKNRSNKAKHGVSFETAALVFDDPFHRSVPAWTAGEERWETLGRAAGVVLLLVVHAFPDVGDEEVVRIISARKATPPERRRYEESH